MHHSLINTLAALPDTGEAPQSHAGLSIHLMRPQALRSQWSRASQFHDGMGHA